MKRQELLLDINSLVTIEKVKKEAYIVFHSLLLS